jgi:hypothetical protein
MLQLLFRCGLAPPWRRVGASLFLYVPGKPLDHSQANDIMRQHPSKADHSVARKEVPNNAAIGAHAACSAPLASLEQDRFG